MDKKLGKLKNIHSYITALFFPYNKLSNITNLSALASLEPKITKGEGTK